MHNAVRVHWSHAAGSVAQSGELMVDGRRVREDQKMLLRELCPARQVLPFRLCAAIWKSTRYVADEIDVNVPLYNIIWIIITSNEE